MNKSVLTQETVLLLDHWETSLVHLSTEGSLLCTSNLSLLYSRSLCLLFRIRQLYSRVILYLEIANSNFPLLFRLLSRDCNSVLLILFSDIFSCREKLEHIMPIRIFEKFHFTPKSCFLRCSRSNFQI